MPLSKLSIKNFRCFHDIEVELSPGINFFYGANGSGKTSLLEAIFLFSSGKSFKSSDLTSLIKYNSQGFKLKAFENNKGYVIEIEKAQSKSIKALLNNKKIVRSELVKELPSSVIHNETFSFASASPDFRRRLLDRSIFIAEQNFSTTWFAFYRALKQRNQLLKNDRISDTYPWNEKIFIEGNKLNELRKIFFNRTLLEFNSIVNEINISEFFNFFNYISIEYYQGWDNAFSLEDIIEKNKNKDSIRKTTSQGPHRCDIKFQINNVDARQVLSRGEQKFFSILWSCAQHNVLKKNYMIEATLIIDDIKSELDERVFSLLIEHLKIYKNQTIFSCIEDCFSSKMFSNNIQFKKFHVEQLR